MEGGKKGRRVLPEDILFEEILVRVGVELLVRFKLVSKRWLHLISHDSRFIHHHMRRQPELSLILSWGCGAVGRLYLFDTITNAPKCEVKDTSLHTIRYCGIFRTVRVVASCNGLLCLLLHIGFPLESYREAVVLWNPETRQFRDTLVPPLPQSFYQRPGEPDLPRRGEDYHFYAFGFDQPHDDYKVVRVVPTRPTHLNFDVFSRNSGCWTRLPECLIGYTVCFESAEPVQVGACFYSLVLAVQQETSATRRCILSFNLGDHRFQIIDVLEPHLFYDSYPFRHQLVKWNRDCLAYVSPPHYEPWYKFKVKCQLVLDGNGNLVLPRNNDRDLSWVSEPLPVFRYVNIPFFSFPWKFCGVSRDRFFVVEQHAEARTELRHYPSDLVIYDSLTHVYENTPRQAMSIPSCGFGRFSSAHDYVPSLVSLYPDRKTMMEAKKKMELMLWVRMFWKIVGLTKKEFSSCTSGP